MAGPIGVAGRGHVGVQGNGTKRGVVGLGGPVGDYYKGVRDLPGLRFACLKAQGELEGGSAAQGASGSKSQPTKPIEIIDGCTPFETANQREAQLLANKAREAEEEVDGTTEALNETPKELDDSQRNILARVLLCKASETGPPTARPLLLPADCRRLETVGLPATGAAPPLVASVLRLMQLFPQAFPLRQILQQRA